MTTVAGAAAAAAHRPGRGRPLHGRTRAMTLPPFQRCLFPTYLIVLMLCCGVAQGVRLVRA